MAGRRPRRQYAGDLYVSKLAPGAGAGFARRVFETEQRVVSKLHRNQRVQARTLASTVPRRGPAVDDRRKQQVAATPITVEKLGKGLPPQDWTRCNLRDCTGGQLQVAIARIERSRSGMARNPRRDAGI
jgi:hypothetical protein